MIAVGPLDVGNYCIEKNPQKDVLRSKLFFFD